MRSPSFITGPLVPPAARGTWHNGIFSACDWSATFLARAGLSISAMDAREGYGTVPPMDGMDMWGAVMGVEGAT